MLLKEINPDVQSSFTNYNDAMNLMNHDLRAEYIAVKFLVGTETILIVNGMKVDVQNKKYRGKNQR